MSKTTYTDSAHTAEIARGAADVPILKRRKSLGPSAFVFGSPAGEYVESFKTA